MYILIFGKKGNSMAAFNWDLSNASYYHGVGGSIYGRAVFVPPILSILDSYPVLLVQRREGGAFAQLLVGAEDGREAAAARSARMWVHDVTNVTDPDEYYNLDPYDRPEQPNPGYSGQVVSMHNDVLSVGGDLLEVTSPFEINNVVEITPKMMEWYETGQRLNG